MKTKISYVAYLLIPFVIGCSSIEEKQQACVDRGRVPQVIMSKTWLYDCDCDVKSTFHEACKKFPRPSRIIVGPKMPACGAIEVPIVICSEKATVDKAATKERLTHSDLGCLLAETCPVPEPTPEPKHEPLVL